MTPLCRWSGGGAGWFDHTPLQMEGVGGGQGTPPSLRTEGGGSDPPSCVCFSKSTSNSGVEFRWPSGWTNMKGRVGDQHGWGCVGCGGLGSWMGGLVGWELVGLWGTTDSNKKSLAAFPPSFKCTFYLAPTVWGQSFTSQLRFWFEVYVIRHSLVNKTCVKKWVSYENAVCFGSYQFSNYSEQKNRPYEHNTMLMQLYDGCP